MNKSQKLHVSYLNGVKLRYMKMMCKFLIKYF